MSPYFAGSLTLELSRLKRGAKTSKKCNLKLLDKRAPVINLFRIRRTRGWWVFKNYHQKTGTNICAGKVEAEMEVVTQEEALLDPVGLGRREPQALPPPNRPDASFLWFKNPLKSLKLLVCRRYKWKMICCLLIVFGVLFLASTLYSLPGYTIKKMLSV
ncbi:unnamed protein product [Acanthoscelides obtectus]|uniref:Ferlin C-terminal domain-containing protein n=1 Tax=Acanthoscelides obtectus TaxID=200917 RepID=A0A9P0NWU3_ACAOB|nr:unnamed protein product [Acanthoscelides obtectus]CAK1641334.1 Otoferlin [Acanthoscelides obtectus]